MSAEKLRRKALKGQVGGNSLLLIILGVVVSLVGLFVGLFMVDEVASVIDQDALDEYVDDSFQNATNASIGVNGTADSNFGIGPIASIAGVDPTKRVSITVDNQGTTSITVNTTLNTNSLGTFTVGSGAAVTNHFDDVNFVADATNNISVGTTSDEWGNFTVDTTAITLSNSTARTSTGGIFDDLTTSTGTVYNVLILVLIVVGLGIAIGAIRQFGGGSGGAPQV